MPAAKNILLLSSSYPSSLKDGRAAAGFFVKDFAEALAAHCKLSVLTQNTGAASGEIENTEFSVHRFSWSGKGRPLSTLRLPADILAVASIMFNGALACIRFCRRQKTDHVIALWAMPCGLWALLLNKLFNIPYSIWCLGADIWDYADAKITRALLKLILKNARSVYADGYELAEQVNQIADVNCSFLPSSRRFRPPQARITLRPEHVQHCLFVGRYHPNKGPDILVDAIASLPAALRKDMHFHFYGGGPLRAELEAAIASAGLEQSISLGDFIGESELMEVLEAADLIIIPSRKDSVSLMLPAAIHLHKAIIASDVGDTGFLLKKFKVGSVVAANSPAALAECLANNRPPLEDSLQGRQALLELLDISAAAARVFRDLHAS